MMSSYRAYTLDTKLSEVVDLYVARIGQRPNVILAPASFETDEPIPAGVSLLLTRSVSYLMATHEYDGQFLTEAYSESLRLTL